MQFLKGTNYRNGDTVLINLSQICEIWADNQDGTLLFFINSSEPLHIRETFNEIQVLVGGLICE